MLKKMDLAKQFELVVQQEIKNYQDSLNFVLQSIKALKEDADHIRNECLENYASIHGQQVNLEIQLSNLKEIATLTSQKLGSLSADQSTINNKVASEMLDLSDSALDRINNENNLQNKITEIEQQLKDVSFCCNKNHINSLDCIDNLSTQIGKDIIRAKEEIISRPSEIHTIQKKLEEKIDCHGIDVKGILQEINSSKRYTHVLEKKIENIYTIIERLKRSEAIS